MPELVLFTSESLAHPLVIRPCPGLLLAMTQPETQEVGRSGILQMSLFCVYQL